MDSQSDLSILSCFQTSVGAYTANKWFSLNTIICSLIGATSNFSGWSLVEMAMAILLKWYPLIQSDQQKSVSNHTNLSTCRWAYLWEGDNLNPHFPQSSVSWSSWLKDQMYDAPLCHLCHPPSSPALSQIKVSNRSHALYQNVDIAPHASTLVTAHQAELSFHMHNWFYFSTRLANSGNWR